MAFPHTRTLVVTLAALILAACGGGSGGGGDTQPPPDNGGDTGGIDRSGIFVLGSISGFGSVVVDGVRFDTSTATIEVDDEPGSEDDLRTGDIVFVSGEIDDSGNATAATVVADDLLRGPIESIDLAAGTFVVLGQTVKVEVDTAFDDSVPNNDIDGLTVGQPVRVDGFLDPAGRIVATRVEIDDGDDLQVVGVVSELDESALTFSIGTLLIDYATATFEDFDGLDLADGQIVEVEGNALAGGGELPATKVERVTDDFGAEDDDLAEIEGIVTAVLSATEFEVNGITVTTDGATVYEGGASADIAAGVRVDVDAVAQADGSLLATKVEFEAEKIVEIEATVESVDSAAGTLRTLGITVVVGQETRLEDDSDLDLRRFSLADVNVGDFVEIGGSESDAADDEAIAVLLKRDDDGDDGVELQARVQSVSEPDLTLLGVTVRTTVETEFEDGDVEITAAEFFANALGRVVDVDGTWDGSVLTAENVEFEAED